MSPKKTILKELARAHEQSAETTFTRPAAIAGFSREPGKYQKAVNELLQARLIEGRKDSEGHMTIAVNANRLGEVRKQLRPAWSHPALWSVVLLAAAAGAILLM